MILKDKVAIVTCGATGIGEAISRKLAKEGALVVVNGFPQYPVDDVVSRINATGGQAVAFIADVSLEENAKHCIEFAKYTWGKVDILVNTSGVYPIMEELQDYPFQAFEYILRHNLRSAFFMTKYALPELQLTQGCILFSGSEGEQGQAKNAPYDGARGFLHAFMKSIAVEQAKYGVRANCVCTNLIDEAWLRAISTNDEKTFSHATPLGKRHTREEVAKAYAYLASDAAQSITGTIYPVIPEISLSGNVDVERAASILEQVYGKN